MRNEKLRANSAEFVGGALEFRGSPRTVRAVNSDNNPNNNIEEIGTTGIIPDSIHRGGDGDNQFLTGSQDPKIKAAAKVLYSGMPTSSNKGVNLLDLFSSSSNPDGAASVLNGQSGMFSMGSAFTMPTTIVNNYNTVAGGSGSGGDDSFSTGFPSGFSGFIVPYSMDALK